MSSICSEISSVALANQTAKATEEISEQIQDIQSATGEAVAAIQNFVGTIGEINAISGAIASAVDQQSEATREIAGNVQRAATGTDEVKANIEGVTQAAIQTGMAAAKLLSASNGLSTQSEQLKTEVGSFLESIRAA